MAITQDDFKKVWASTSSVPEYTFSDTDYKNGWEFVGNLPPTRAMWDELQRKNDEKMQFLQENGSMCFNSVADMKSSNLDAGQTALTKGYYSINDGGAGVYNIRPAIQTDVEDGGSIIFLDNGNVAEAIKLLYASQFPGDNDAEILQNAIDFAEANNYRVILIDRKFDITGHTIYVVLREQETLRNYLRLVGVGAGELYKGDSGYMFAHNSSSPESLSHGLTFENLTISGEFHTFSFDDETTYDNNCDVIDCAGIIRCTFINCFFHFVRDVLHGESATLQSDYLVNCTLYCCRSYVYSKNPCVVTDFMMNNCMAERSVMAAWFEGGIQDVRFIGNCIEGLIYGIVFFKEPQTSETGDITNVTLIGNAFEQNKKGHIICNPVRIYGLQFMNNGFYVNTPTGYPMITFNAFARMYREVTFYKNHFAGYSDQSIGIHIDTSSGVRNDYCIEFYGKELSNTNFTDKEKSFLNVYDYLEKEKEVHINQKTGYSYTITASQTVVWNNASQGVITLQFPFVAKNINYTVEVTSLSIETVGAIPSSEISVDLKAKEGCRIKIAHAVADARVRTTFAFAAKITFE